MELLQILHNSAEVGAALDRKATEALRVYDNAIGRGALELHREAVRLAPKADGTLIQQSGVEQRGVLERTVVFGARHANAVEEGTGPGGQPTLADTLGWIKRRGITPRTPGMTEESLAFLIRRKIVANGTPAQPFAGPALDVMRPRLVELMNAATRQLLRPAR